MENGKKIFFAWKISINNLKDYYFFFYFLALIAGKHNQDINKKKHLLIKS